MTCAHPNCPCGEYVTEEGCERPGTQTECTGDRACAAAEHIGGCFAEGRTRDERRGLSDHAACQAAVQAIYDAAVEVMDDTTGLTDLMPPRQAFEYRLGTFGQVYHREGITDLIRERDEARWDLSTLQSERDAAILAAQLPLRQALVSIAVGPPPSIKNKVAYDQWLIAKKAMDALDPAWQEAF